VTATVLGASLAPAGAEPAAAAAAAPGTSQPRAALSLPAHHSRSAAAPAPRTLRGPSRTRASP